MERGRAGVGWSGELIASCCEAERRGGEGFGYGEKIVEAVGEGGECDGLERKRSDRDRELSTEELVINLLILKN